MVAHKVGPVAGRLLRLLRCRIAAAADGCSGTGFCCSRMWAGVLGGQYQTVLEVIGVDRESDEYLVIAGLGRAADRYRNVLARPATEVTVGRSRFRPAHRELDSSRRRRPSWPSMSDATGGWRRWSAAL